VHTLTGVTKRYQKGRRTVPAVRDLDLTTEDGEWLAVQGRAGHGKSTLLNLLGGLDRATEGSCPAASSSGSRSPGPWSPTTPPSPAGPSGWG
jgi:ABC-type lipoprotein export system ATPase subunit